jgi:hypothetical protein
MQKTAAVTTAGAVTLVGLDAFTTLALKPTVKPSRTPPVEVRTQVVRRTVWMVTHEHPPVARPLSSGGRDDSGYDD